MNYYCLYDRQETHGYVDNRVLITLYWFDIETLEQYETVVDPTYRNYRRCAWDQICELPEPWGVYTNLHRGRGQTKSGAGILDADTVAHFHEELSLDEISKYVILKQEQIDKARQRPKLQFHRGLFEQDD